MKRNSAIDFIKGVAIIAMLIGHASPPAALGRFIYLWHMAVFFMASGFFFLPERVADFDGLVQFSKRRIVKLLLVAISWTLVMHLCHNGFASFGLQGYDHWSATDFYHHLRWAFFLLQAPNPAFWFIKTLFMVSVSYAALSWLFSNIDKLFRRKGLYFKPRFEYASQGVLAIGMLLVSNRVHFPRVISMVVGGEVFFTAYALFHLGRCVALISPLLERIRDSLCIRIAAAVISLAILLAFTFSLDKFELAANQYHSAFVMLAASITGWVFLDALRYMIESSGGAILCVIIECVGRHTMSIMLFHWLVFQVLLRLGFVASSGICHCIVYSAVAVCVALILSAAWSKIVNIKLFRQ